MHSVNAVNTKAFILNPSAFGAVTFGAALILYQVNLVGYDEAAPETLLYCWTAFGFFSVSALMLHSAYIAAGRSLGSAVRLRRVRQGVGSALPIVLLHLIGAFGVLSYARNLANHFGSWAELGLRMWISSYEVRWAAEEVSSLGTQVSYFGWVAIWLTAYRECRGGSSGWLRLAMVGQLLLNLVYVDRTRPLWIIFGVVTIVAAMRYSTTSGKRLFGSILFFGFAAVSTFILLGGWIGKIDLYGSGDSGSRRVAALLEPVYFYGTSGFAYFNHIVLYETPDGSMGRTTYPLATALARIDVTEAPPSQVNQFIQVPMDTNVGTFLEPFYRDGGVIFGVIGMLLHSVGFGLLGLLFVRRGTPLALIGWSALCFCNFFAFFTPKFNNTPTWLFVGVAVGSLLLGAPRRANDTASHRLINE